ncbi:MAG TPA: redox-regulated ATPase YchF [Anaerohalosphaeraceae bacterium]|nr:redox-regulated ATPase YchF [Anaerohalosphaeraceae bacterium]HOL30572.1 redox-regulated ATPase YchF [Anaerohalosphaeraceae bacterium]HOM75056.1 redox-regulated ATPase YchF [Anaerohalosphaeraceae bacterium]HPC63607.1 redox-regulated ATPase YchF [Anaerohalosphaeraceae bacterium]HPO68861.1 redox-regulated ATPase YchF [Anaerohalosphaeraceae bacterium]
MKVALIGLMQSGKSTLLSAISGKEPAPMGSPDIHEHIVSVPDDRLDWLTELYQPKKTVHATVDCLDLPGLSFADEHGRAAARRLFGQIRTADMFVLVIRDFDSPSVPAYRGSVDPVRDLEELKTEMLLADLEMVTTRIDRLQKQAHKPTKTQAHDKAELELQLKLQAAIEAEKPLRSVLQESDGPQMEMVRSLNFLTLKPLMVVVNVGENRLGQNGGSSIGIEGVPVIRLCAKLECELAKLDPDSRADFMKEMGLAQPASKQFVQCCYSTLGLISFLTVGKDEVRAWPIEKGTAAVDAAGKVHSDIKRGFIRAETISYEDLRRLGDEKAVRAAGKMRLEGKSYIVQDGDIINFRFNV